MGEAFRFEEYLVLWSQSTGYFSIKPKAGLYFEIWPVSCERQVMGNCRMFVVGILAISNDKGIQDLAPEKEFWTLLVTSREWPTPWHLSSSIPQVSQIHWGLPGVQLPRTSLCAHNFPLPRLLSSLLIAPVHSSSLRSGVTP